MFLTILQQQQDNSSNNNFVKPHSLAPEFLIAPESSVRLCEFLVWALSHQVPGTMYVCMSWYEMLVAGTAECSLIKCALIQQEITPAGSFWVQMQIYIDVEIDVDVHLLFKILGTIYCTSY